MGLVLLLALFGAMWFFTIRPQQQRLRAQRALVASLDVGDEVVTAGGVIGRVVSLADQEMTIDSGGTRLRMSRAAVTHRLSGGA